MQCCASHGHPHRYVQLLAKVPEKFDHFACQGPLEPVEGVDKPLFVLKCAPGLSLTGALPSNEIFCAQGLLWLMEHVRILILAHFRVGICTPCSTLLQILKN